MSLFAADGVRHHRTEAREVFDVCGAGDTVIATLAAFLARGCSLDESARWANRAAGIAVSRFGTTAVSLAELGLSEIPAPAAGETSARIGRPRRTPAPTLRELAQ
jgi:bifunctional ADP-heptose synthase (sugar kinase/adenylyltransferase)